jgi:hypothetical protein
LWTTGPLPFRQLTYALFAAGHRITARFAGPLPPLAATQAAALERAFGRLLVLADNDGMVPTRSQVWGEIVHAAWGDHLDAIGHFYLPQHEPPHFDWINSGIGFALDDFERMWTAVGRFLFA